MDDPTDSIKSAFRKLAARPLCSATSKTTESPRAKIRIFHRIIKPLLNPLNIRTGQVTSAASKSELKMPGAAKIGHINAIRTAEETDWAGA